MYTMIEREGNANKLDLNVTRLILAYLVVIKEAGRKDGGDPVTPMTDEKQDSQRYPMLSSLHVVAYTLIFYKEPTSRPSSKSSLFIDLKSANCSTKSSLIVP